MPLKQKWTGRKSERKQTRTPKQKWTQPAFAHQPPLFPVLSPTEGVREAGIGAFQVISHESAFQVISHESAVGLSVDGRLAWHCLVDAVVRIIRPEPPAQAQRGRELIKIVALV